MVVIELGGVVVQLLGRVCGQSRMEDGRREEHVGWSLKEVLELASEVIIFLQNMGQNTGPVI